MHKTRPTERRDDRSWAAYSRLMVDRVRMSCHVRAYNEHGPTVPIRVREIEADGEMGRYRKRGRYRE